MVKIHSIPQQKIFEKIDNVAVISTQKLCNGFLGQWLGMSNVCLKRNFISTLMELSSELSIFLKRRNAVRYRARRPEIEFDKNHLYLQSIKMENIEEILLQKYRMARFLATRRIQSALFDTLSVAINIAETNRLTVKK